MKNSNYIFESVLLAITLILGFGALVSWSSKHVGELNFIYLLWLIPLGIMQVIHSLVLVSVYWKFEVVRMYFIAYYIGVGIDFIFLVLGFTAGQEIFLWMAVVFVPIPLYILVWYITYRFREPALPVESEKYPGDIF